jgi:hypothetical protein
MWRPRKEGRREGTKAGRSTGRKAGGGDGRIVGRTEKDVGGMEGLWEGWKDCGEDGRTDQQDEHLGYETHQKVV